MKFCLQSYLLKYNLEISYLSISNSVTYRQTTQINTLSDATAMVTGWSIKSMINMKSYMRQFIWTIWNIFVISPLNTNIIIIEYPMYQHSTTFLITVNIPTHSPQSLANNGYQTPLLECPDRPHPPGQAGAKAVHVWGYQVLDHRCGEWVFLHQFR